MEINIRALKAISLAADTDEFRRYLHGVNLSVDNGFMTLIATNGHMLMGMQFPVFPIGVEEPPFNVTIPMKMIKKIRVSKNIETANIFIKEKKISIEYDDCTYHGESIPGSFPDYKKTFPTTFSGKVSQFNPKYLKLFYDASKIMKTPFPDIIVEHNGVNPAIVHWHDNALGILMPLRPGKKATIPDWALQK